MKLILKIFLLISFLIFNATLNAQTNFLKDFNEKREKTNKTAMTVLGSWAIGNIALGASLQGSADGSTKYFHRMNAGWNLVNLGIATTGFLAYRKSKNRDLSLFETMETHHKTQKIFLFNAGLDVGYMLGGLYLTERAKNTIDIQESNKLKGFGRSILLQGAFLFVFDVTTVFFHSRNNRKFQPILDGLSFTGNRVRLVVNLN